MRRSALALGPALLAWGLAGWVGTQVRLPRPVLSPQDVHYSVDADIALLASMGLRNTMADVIWVQTLIESDLEHYRGVHLGSWMYRRFELISRLDPIFYENYQHGSQYLMVVKDDIEGARALLNRGLERFPDDMTLNWQMGYLHIFERGDVAEGYPYFAKVHRHPNRPARFDSIFSRLSAEVVGLPEAHALTLVSWRQQPEGSPLRERLGQILHAMQAELDFACVPTQGRPCRPVDFTGRPYIFKQGKWDTEEKRIRLSLKLKRDEKKTPPPVEGAKEKP